MDQRPPRRRRSINNDDLKDDGGGDGMQMGGGEGAAPQGGNGQAGRQRAQAPATQNVKSPVQPALANDGKLYEAAGTWTYAIDSPQGGAGVLVLTKNENQISGTIKGDRMNEEVPLENINIEGNVISFSYPVTFGGNTRSVNVKAVIGENEMQGTMNMGERTFNLSGKRK